MKMNASGRQRIAIIVAVLVVAALAGWWISREAPEAEPPRAAPAPAGAAVPRPPAQPLPPMQKASAGNPAAAPEKSVDLFAVHTWEPPPPPQPALALQAPQPPQAPPLPFRFMGRIAEPGKTPVFLLLQGDRVVPAKLGQRIGGEYRLEKFSGGQLFFRYRPMNQVQTLPVGGPQ